MMSRAKQLLEEYRRDQDNERYHVVCHNCRFELVPKHEKTALLAAAQHSKTGHAIDVARLEGPDA